MVLYGERNRHPNPDPCPSNKSGHYCRRQGNEWVCTYCGGAIKSYTGPSILDTAPTSTEA